MNRSCGEKHTYRMFLVAIFLDVFFLGGGGGVSDKYTQRIFMVCLVSQNVSAGGKIHSDVTLKVFACPLVFELVCKKTSKFALDNQVAISKQMHKNCSIMCMLPDVFLHH